MCDVMYDVCCWCIYLYSYIYMFLCQRAREIARLRREENIIVQDDILEHENVNRMRTEQKQADAERYQGGVIDASSLDEALEQLTVEQQ